MEQTFGDSRYELRGEISKGGRGVTYRAWDREKQIEVALKVVGSLGADSNTAAFHRDCSVWAGISHPSLAELLDSGEIHHDGRARPFVATPIYAGVSLRDLLQRYKRGLRPELVAQVFAQAAHAIHALHQHGLIHRNLKPSKILVQPGGGVRVLDPGVGLGASIALTASIRTMPYMAPEVLRMENSGVASDIYALGIICYEAITNVQPFAGSSEDEITRAVLEKIPAPAEQLAPGLPLSASSAIVRAIKKDASSRFHSAAQFADALSGQVVESPPLVPSQLAPTTRYEPVVTTPPVEMPPQEHDRAQDLDLLKRFSERTGAADVGKFAQRIRETTLRTAALYPGDAEIQRLAEEILNSLDPLRQATVPPDQPLFDASASPVSPPAVPVSTETPSPVAPPGGKRQVSSVLKYVLVGAGVFLVLAGVFALTQWRSSSDRSAASSAVRVEIRTVPQGARILIGGEPKGISNLILDLPPSSYEAVAEMDGFQPTSAIFTVEEGKPAVIDISLNEWLNTIKVTSEIDGAVPAVSGRPLVSTSMGEFALGQLNDGVYVLQVDTPQVSAKVPMQLNAKEVASVQGAIAARGLDLVILAMQGDRLRVYSASPRARAGLDGKPPEAVPADGLMWSELRSGPHELTYVDGQATRTIQTEISGAPIVHGFVFAKQEADKGTLLVVAGVDDATVSINGAASRRVTQRGSLRLTGLAPGSYRIGVAKSGFEPAAEQTVKVVAGKEAKVEFALKPVIRPATLVVRHEPGTDVLVDGQVVATIRGEGSASVEMAPGTHRIELRRGSARSASVAHDFKPGESWHPPQGTFTLVQPDGVIRFDVTPAEARLSVRRGNEPESAAKPISQGTISLPQGDYVVTATAPRHSPASVRFSSQPGTTVTVPVHLVAQGVEPPKPVARGMSAFDDAAGWTQDGQWFVRRGGNYITYGPTSIAGGFTFTIQQRRGKRLQWFVNYGDAKNHRVFRLDKKTFSRAIVENGRTTETGRRDLGFEPGEDFEIRIDVERNRVAHYIRRSGQWTILDEWRDPNADFTSGKFGFYIPGGKFLAGADEYAIRGFSFLPAR